MTADDRDDDDETATVQMLSRGVNSFDPIATRAEPALEVIQQLFDGLFTFRNGEEESRANLVTGYTTSDEYTTYTFSLAEGVAYHDGREVTAADVEYAFERVADSTHSHRLSRRLLFDWLQVTHDRDSDGNYVPWSLGVDATDRYEVQLDLERAFHDTFDVLAYAAFVPLPEGIVGDVEGYDGEMSYDTFAQSNPIGAGPFELDGWDDGSGGRVTRFADYHGDSADVAAVTWAVRTDADAHYQAILDREADVFGIPTSKYDPDKVEIEETDDRGRKTGSYGPLENDATLDYSKVPTASIFYAGLNTEVVPTAARKAFAYALDQHATVADIFKGRHDPAYHLTPPLLYPGKGDEYTEHATGEYPYGYAESQMEAAKAVMAEAGYGPDNRVSFTFTHYTSDAWAAFGDRMAARLDDVYIDLTIEEVSFGKLLTKGRHGELDAYVLGWIVDWPEADNVLQLIYPPNTDTSTDDPMTFVDWVGTDAAQTAADAYETVLANFEPTSDAEATRNDAYVAIEEANWADAVLVPLFHWTEERFWYEEVDIPLHGVMGSHRQKYTQVSVSDD